MKKLLTFLIAFLIFTVSVSASQCTVESGTGKDIGDEIACGSEHFYVIDNSNDQIKMLSKYNLYIGSIYYKAEKNSKDECINYSSEQQGYFKSYNEETHVCMYFKSISDLLYLNKNECNLDSFGNNGTIFARYYINNVLS